VSGGGKAGGSVRAVPCRTGENGGYRGASGEKGMTGSSFIGGEGAGKFKGHAGKQGKRSASRRVEKKEKLVPNIPEGGIPWGRCLGKLDSERWKSTAKTGRISGVGRCLCNSEGNEKPTKWSTRKNAPQNVTLRTRRRQKVTRENK